MRPRQEIRTALAEAALALQKEQGAATWRDLAERACVGYDKACETVRNMATAGELRKVDTVRVGHARRPMVRYAPVSAWGSTGWGSPATLDAVLRTWRG
jgi:hypothetical protein